MRGCVATLALCVDVGTAEVDESRGDRRGSDSAIVSVVTRLPRKRAIKPFSPGPADAGGLGTETLNLLSVALAAIPSGTLSFAGS